MTEGKKDTIAWFCCFAPFRSAEICGRGDGPGRRAWRSVAAPIATRILERTLAMDEGKFDPQVAWLAPAHHPNPFAMIEAVNFKDRSTNVGTDEEHGDDSQAADTQMAAAGAIPMWNRNRTPRARYVTGKRASLAALPAAPPPENQIFSTTICGHRNRQRRFPLQPHTARRSRGF